MAVNKELRKYLDKDAKGQYKKTQKNIAKLLVFYGYDTKDVQDVFNTKQDYYSRYIDEDMVKREVNTSPDYFSKEEKELVGNFLDDIERVYKENNESTTTTTTRGRVSKKTRVKVSKPSHVESKEEGITEESVGLTEDKIQNKNLLGKLGQLTQSSGTETEKVIQENRNEQAPIVTEAPTSGVCGTCEGRGWVMSKGDDGKVRKSSCPECLGQPVRVESEEFTRYGEPLLEELIQNKYYLNTSFNTSKLLDDNMEAYHTSTRQFENYVEFLNDKLTEVRGGDIPLKSYYIATPDGYGKKHFAYQLMKEAVRYGHRPTQLLNGGLLLDLYNKREFQELNDLLDGDIVFVTLSALSRTNGLGNIIKYIADDAERRGVPVFMFGRVSVEVFLRDKDYNLPSLLGRYIQNGDYGHFQCEGFFGKDFNTLARLQRERMSGTLLGN